MTVTVWRFLCSFRLCRWSCRTLSWRPYGRFDELDRKPASETFFDWRCCFQKAWCASSSLTLDAITPLSATTTAAEKAAASVAIKTKCTLSFESLDAWLAPLVVHGRATTKAPSKAHNRGGCTDMKKAREIWYDGVSCVDVLGRHSRRRSPEQIVKMTPKMRNGIRNHLHCFFVCEIVSLSCWSSDVCAALPHALE